MADFFDFVSTSSDEFFEVEHSKLVEAQQKLFIIVDDPSSSPKTPNKFEWPEINKLETYLKESCIVIQQTRLFLEEIKGLYDAEDAVIFDWITEKVQTSYLLKACRTQSIGKTVTVS